MLHFYVESCIWTQWFLMYTPRVSTVLHHCTIPSIVCHLQRRSIERTLSHLVHLYFVPHLYAFSIIPQGKRTCLMILYCLLWIYFHWICFIVHHFLFSPFSRSLPSVVLYTLCFLPLDLYILYRFLYYFWIYHPLSILLHYSCDLSFPTLYWSFMQNCSYFRNVVINCLFFVH